MTDIEDHADRVIKATTSEIGKAFHNPSESKAEPILKWVLKTVAIGIVGTMSGVLALDFGREELLIMWVASILATMLGVEMIYEKRLSRDKKKNTAKLKAMSENQTRVYWHDLATRAKKQADIYEQNIEETRASYESLIDGLREEEYKKAKAEIDEIHRANLETMQEMHANDIALLQETMEERMAILVSRLEESQKMNRKLRGMIGNISNESGSEEGLSKLRRVVLSSGRNR